MSRITGTSGDDRGAKTLNGTSQADEIFGLAGNDTLIGYGGGDILTGGAGADELFGRRHRLRQLQGIEQRRLGQSPVSRGGNVAKPRATRCTASRG